MATDMNLPRLNDLAKLLITSKDLGPDKETAFVESIRADKVKMLVTENHISCVMLAPEVYNAFLEAAERMVNAPAPAAAAPSFAAASGDESPKKPL